MAQVLNIGVIGSTGKMGQRVDRLLRADDQTVFNGGISSQSSVNDVDKLCATSDVVIDFSHNNALESVLPSCIKNSTPIVSGTTALTDSCLELINKASKNIPVLHTSNFCVSIHIIADFLKSASGMLSDYDIDIVETHHKMKKDAPSGTALLLRNSIDKDNVSIISRRCGDCTGKHVVSFFGRGEVLSIKHEAFNRDIFAKGAIDVAKWIKSQPNGLYTMQDYICAQRKT